MPAFLGSASAGQDGPHRCHFDRVRGDVDALDLLRAEVLEVDFDFIVEADVVRHVDLDGAVAERLHHFVALELLVFRLVGVAQDDFVDVGLGEFLGLDQMFLAGAQQVVQERDVELEDFDEFDDAAIGDVEFAVEVEGARVGVGAELGDLAVVDVAGQFGAVLVLFVLGLEGADAAAVLFGEDQAFDLHVIHRFFPVAAIGFQKVAINLSAEGADVAVEANLAALGRAFR